MSEKETLTAGSLLVHRNTIVTQLPQLDLPPHLMEHYHIIRKRFANPIVEMRNGTCLGCFMVLSSHNQQKIKSGEYDMCETCGRILYYEGY